MSSKSSKYSIYHKKKVSFKNLKIFLKFFEKTFSSIFEKNLKKVRFSISKISKIFEIRDFSKKSKCSKKSKFSKVAKFSTGPAVLLNDSQGFARAATRVAVLLLACWGEERAEGSPIPSGIMLQNERNGAKKHCLESRCETLPGRSRTAYDRSSGATEWLPRFCAGRNACGGASAGWQGGGESGGAWHSLDIMLQNRRQCHSSKKHCSEGATETLHASVNLPRSSQSETKNIMQYHSQHVPKYLERNPLIGLAPYLPLVASDRRLCHVKSSWSAGFAQMNQTISSFWVRT